MGRGASKAGAGGAGGRQAQNAPKTTPKQEAEVNKVLDYITKRNATRGGYSYKYLDRDGKTVNDNSNVGDVLRASWSNRNPIEFVKIGNDQWSYNSMGRTRTTDTPNVVASLSSFSRANGKLSFSPKR